MYCKCSKGNNYKVIGLCDPKKFDQENTAAWTQITVPEILPLPECFPDIEDLERVYVNVVIESVRVIETPVATGNTEGTILTGKKLIVDGNVCQTVVYTADVCEQSLHSINFKYPFCTSIVLDPSVNVEESEFCVKACIEDVFAKALNPRTIFKSVTLFLIAEAATVSCPGNSSICGTITNTSTLAGNIDVTVELYDEDGKMIAYQQYSIANGASQNYCFNALCNGKYKIEFETTTVGVKMNPALTGFITVPTGAIGINSTIVDVNP